MVGTIYSDERLGILGKNEEPYTAKSMKYIENAVLLGCYIVAISVLIVLVYTLSFYISDYSI